MKLGKYINIINGFPFDSKDFNTEQNGYPVIKIKELKKNSISITKDTCYTCKYTKLENFLIEKNDILIALTGNPPLKGGFDAIVGRCSKYNLLIPAYLNQRVCKVFSNNSILLNSYLYYFLSLDKTTLELAYKCSGSANQANISSNDIKDLEFNLPSLGEQQHIVNTIGSVDDLIENLTQQNEKIITIGLTKINSFNNRTTNDLSEIVEFSKGYEVGSLNYSEIKKDSMISYLRVGDLASLGNTYVEYDDKLVISSFDDILCAFDGAPGRNNIGLVGAYSSGIYNLKCHDVNKGLVYFEINSDLNQKIINNHSQGTTILHASKAIKYLQYADIEFEDKIYLNSLFKLLLQNKKKIECLKNIKSNLLNRYF